MADDDRELMERLAVLEAEVKAAEQAKRPKAIAVRPAKPTPPPVDLDEHEEPRPRARSRSDIGGALALAKRADDVREELSRVPKDGEKSWVKAGIGSMLLGPLGWLYAGSFREAVPASAAYIALAAFLSFIPIPSLLLMPLIFVALPLSGIAGAMYAVQYNRTGKRQRLWGDKDKGKKPKLLP